MKKILTAVAVAFAGFSGAAHAATLDVLLGSGGTYTISSGPDLTSNITLTDLNTQFSKALGASLSGGVLTVGNGSPHSIYGYADFTINNPMAGQANPQQFGFTWLNPLASQNVQVVTSASNGGLGSYAISGSSLTPYISGPSPLNIVIIDPFAVLTSAEFDSTFGNGTTTGFQVTNFAVKGTPVSTVPLPGSVGLFLTGLAGLYLLRRKAII